jgi:hypothetical protein
MLVREDGDALWLGQAIPRAWLAVGKRVAVNDAPTSFGAVSYSIDPITDSSMRVQISPPVRSTPKEIILRLRHPGHLNIAAVKADVPSKIWFSKDTVRLTGLSEPITLEVKFR